MENPNWPFLKSLVAGSIPIAWQGGSDWQEEACDNKLMHTEADFLGKSFSGAYQPFSPIFVTEHPVNKSLIFYFLSSNPKTQQKVLDSEQPLNFNG